MSAQPLTIVQLNMGRAAAVSDQLLSYCQDTGVDIALVQEPYTNRGRLTGFEVAPIRCYLSMGTRSRGGPRHIDHGAAIIVFNPNLVVASRDSGRVENFVSIDLDCGAEGQWTMISGYFKYRVPTEIHVSALESLMEQNVNSLLMGLDANAFSTRWFSRINDRRGEVLSQFIDAQRLQVENKRSAHTTFRGPRGKTNIDVTLSSGQISTRVRNWTVLPGITSSDHQLIRYEVDAQPRRFVQPPPRYNVKRTLVEQFKMEFHLRSEGRQGHPDIDSMANAIVEDITAAADLHIPKSSHRRKVKPPWWTDELLAARRNLRRVARRVDDTVTRAEYNVLRNSYTSLLRKCKIESWRRFCTTEGKLPWGKLYRWMRKGVKPQLVPVLMMRPDGTLCQTLEESLTSLLNTLIPNDPDQEDPAPVESNEENWTETTEEELRTFAWSVAPNRAPGADCISGKMVRLLWQNLHPRLLSLANSCMRRAKFPKDWKAAVVVPILKGVGRDIRNPKSYRPVSLLPVLGKIVEKIINVSLRTQIEPRLTGKQYGFTPGRSTLDAIRNLLTWSRLNEEKYVLTVFLDITGAFDNLKWSALLEDLATLGVTEHTRSLIMDYLSGRTATLNIGGVSKTVRVTKGCPRGSILGPILWNVTMEALLRAEQPQYVNMQAYADDVAISVAGPTRASIIRRTEQALQPVLQWARSRGLSFSAQKSTAMITKGSLVHGFTLAFGDERIVTVPHTKYLGVTIDSDWKWDVHIERLTEDHDDIFSRLRGTMGAGWGTKRENLMTLYRGVFLPRVAYGVSLWVHAAGSEGNKKRLHRLQRRVLLGLTCAYRTTSTDALQVLAGVLPLDLELKWIAIKEEAKGLPEGVRRGTTHLAYEDIMDEWQRRWSNSHKGRWTYQCFPDVRARLTSPLAMGHEVAQFLTGHGNFRAKLAYFGRQPSPVCLCGAEDEFVDHVLFRCERHSVHRAHLELEVHRAGHLWPCGMETLVSSKRLYTALVRFAKTAAYYEQLD